VGAGHQSDPDQDFRRDLAEVREPREAPGGEAVFSGSANDSEKLVVLYPPGLISVLMEFSGSVI